MIWLLLFSLVATALPAFLFLRNLRLLQPAPAGAADVGADVSILIPARDEERNIEQAVGAALANRATEVIVLDDHSTDRTAELLQTIHDPRLRVVSGRPLPANWCGKNFACHQLAEHARGNYLLFIDADVRLAPDASVRLKAEAAKRNAQLVSGVPREITGTFFEELMIPLIHFVLLGFLPIARMRASSAAAYATGCGQLIFVNAEAYHRSGGHASFCHRLHDGLELPRAFRRAGLHTDLCDATDLASCRMYRSAGETWRGFVKNAHEGLGAPARILPATLFLGAAVFPFVVLLAKPKLSLAEFSLAAVAATLALLPRLAGQKRFHQPARSILFHPLALLVLIAIQWVGLARHLLGRPVPWKKRVYSSAGDGMPPANASEQAPERVEHALH